MADKQRVTVIGRPFKSGQSGNPAGRPADVSGIRKAILRVLGRKRDGKRTLDALVDVLTDKALSGNLVAAKLLIEYSYGKPATVADAVTWAADRAVTLRDVLMSPEFNNGGLRVFTPDPEEERRAQEQRERLAAQGIGGTCNSE